MSDYTHIPVRIGTGDAPCGVCGRHIWNIPLDLDSRVSDGNGGWWWKTINGGKCLGCGEPIIWYHKSPPISMDLAITQEYAITAPDAGKEGHATHNES